ncbi:hypothetical protein T492DRAFT_872139 [Pavlovales sp. CCMP2436]|nr:hypothetical protein T492DRAFT_872139 [Pavlovales sp. CCMP2436]
MRSLSSPILFAAAVVPVPLPSPSPPLESAYLPDDDKRNINLARLNIPDAKKRSNTARDKATRARRTAEREREKRRRQE